MLNTVAMASPMTTGNMHDNMETDYMPPPILTISSGVSLALGAICFLLIAGDIIWRKGWKSMMGVMIVKLRSSLC